MDNKAGARITQLRKERKWTQEKLADKAGVNVATLRRWGNGDTLPQTRSYKLVLTALGATKREQQDALALLDRPGAIQELSGTMWTPHTGDLLRVLRLRRGLSLTQAAAQLQISKSTISRWEKGSVPEAERLSDICAVYATRPEERAALVNSKSLLTLPLTAGDTMEQCEHRLHTLVNAMNHSEMFAGEPCFILLEAQFAGHAKQNEQALRLLAMCWTYHADYLLWRHRTEEAYRYASRALRIVQNHFLPEAFWLHAAGLKAQYVRDYSTGGTKAAYAQLNDCLELAGKIGSDVCILRDMGGIAANMDQWEHARRLFTQSRRIAQQREIHWGVRLANIEEANTYLRESRPEDALPFLAQDDNSDPNGHLTEIKLWVQTLRALGDKRDVDDWIKRGDALFTGHDLEFRRIEWERLKQRG